MGLHLNHQHFILLKQNIEPGEIVQGLKAVLALAEDCVRFLASMLGGLQLQLQENLMPFSGLHEHLTFTHMPPHKHIIKNKKKKSPATWK